MKVNHLTLLTNIHAKLPIMLFKPQWNNGTGYLDGAVYEQVTEPVTCCDSFGRKVVLIPNVLGFTAVFFQRSLNEDRVCYHVPNMVNLSTNRRIGGNTLYQEMDRNTETGMFAYGLLLMLHRQVTDSNTHDAVMRDIYADAHATPGPYDEIRNAANEVTLGQYDRLLNGPPYADLALDDKIEQRDRLSNKEYMKRKQQLEESRTNPECGSHESSPLIPPYVR